MVAVENNPFRIIGVLANAREKDIHRQKVKISKYVSVGKSVVSEYDYDLFSPIERTEKSVKDAFSNIDQRQDKLEHSLFWFVNCNQFDEIALTHLGESNQEKAMSTWARVVDGREMTPKLISCLNNYSTLQLCSGSENLLSSGIANKLKLIQSHAFSTFIAAVTDDSFVVNSHQQAQKFIKRIIQLLLGNKKTETEIVSYFSLCNRWVKDLVAQSFCESLIFEIERAVESTEKQRKQNRYNAYTLAITLKNNTIYRIKKVSDLLGINNIKFKTVSDALAQEIFSCDIANFNASQQSSNLFNKSLELLGYAKVFATSEKTRREIESSTDDMLGRKEQYQVKKYYSPIYEEIENFKKMYICIENTQSFINVCAPKLDACLSELGRTEDFIKLSSVVVTVAINVLIKKVNGVQEGSYSSEVILSTFRNACTAMNALSKLTMDAETRARFNTNNQTITELHSKASASQREQQSKASASQREQQSKASASQREQQSKASAWQRERQSKASAWQGERQKQQEGCYIATMAYGDCGHPQVIRLREFRDQTLAKTRAGRSFIRLYYKYSPLMVRKLKNNLTINKIVRFCLDSFIKQMDKK